MRKHSKTERPDPVLPPQGSLSDIGVSSGAGHPKVSADFRWPGPFRELEAAFDSMAGAAECVGKALPASHPVQDSLSRIAAEIATARSLVFSMARKDGKNGKNGSVQAPRPTRVQPVLDEILRFLRAMVPSNLRITAEPPSRDHEVPTEPAEFQRLLLSLCASAVRAIGEGGGALEFKQAVVECGSQQPPPHVDLGSGRFWKLELVLSGPQVSLESVGTHLPAAFDVRWCGCEGNVASAVGTREGHTGGLMIYSEAGRGALFTLYLPMNEEESASDSPAGTVDVAPRKRIMVVDDDETVGILTARMLGRLNFEAVAFERPEEALAVLGDDPAAIDLVITDFSMPRLSGAEFIDRARSLRPGLPVVVTTGHCEAIEADHPLLLTTCQVLRKPFDSTMLAHTVRGILSGSSRRMQARC